VSVADAMPIDSVTLAWPEALRKLLVQVLAVGFVDAGAAQARGG
jgi:hypothetical protein